jgi:hypothetical protein
MKKIITTFAVCVFALNIVHAQVFYAGTLPGKAKIIRSEEGFILKNNVLQTAFSFTGKKFSQIKFRNILTHQNYNFLPANFFYLVLNDGKKAQAGDFRIVGKPVINEVAANHRAVKLSENERGEQLSAVLYNESSKIKLHWHAVLRNNSNYIQQSFSFRENDPEVKIDRAYLINFPASGSLKKCGIVDGLPLVDKGNFFAIECPMSKIDSTNNGVHEFLYRDAVVPAGGNELHASTVYGVTPVNQLRRGFLYYVERERAEPYKPFLHYNSWFDLSWGKLRLNEADCLDRIQTWSDSLTVKRGVRLDGYLWDDGWDDYNSLWEFTKSLPNGFKNLYALSSKYGATMGVWVSPWGGYDEPKEKRIAFGKSHVPPYETNEHGFSLSGKNYFNYFKSLAVNFIQQQHVAIFKFDGVGSGTYSSGAGLAYQSDICALLRFIDTIRKVKPNTYLSLTVGTWPSPYLLRYGNNVWRGGGDYSFIGQGDTRQRWLNYRDHDTYVEVVRRSPLFPLNAVMNHGIMVADHGQAAPSDINDKDITDDIWAFFGNGTSLQEMYINPHKINSYQWNVLAKAIKWSRAHRDVLSDVHWVGGDPAKQEVYGFASWNPKHGTLTLRNPSGKEQKFSFSLDTILELPNGYKGNYKLFNVVDNTPEGAFRSSNETTLSLKPFEVKVINVERD